MAIISSSIIVIVAMLHLYIFWLESFAWTTRGRKVFKKFPAELFEKTKPMAANQGLYNGFLAVGLLWSLLIETPDWRFNIAMFFLGCVAVAGLFGAATVQKSIFYIQSVPAIAGMVCLYFNI